MTGRRRNDGQRQRRALDLLGLSRRRSPGPAGGSVQDCTDLPMLAVLAALEHASDLARLSRLMAADPADDTRYRRLVVIVNAAARAVADDLTTGTTDSTETLYLAVTAMQKHREDR